MKNAFTKTLSFDILFAEETWGRDRRTQEAKAEDRLTDKTKLQRKYRGLNHSYLTSSIIKFLTSLSACLYLY